MTADWVQDSVVVEKTCLVCSLPFAGNAKRLACALCGEQPAQDTSRFSKLNCVVGSLALASIASCTCGVKTPHYEYHNDRCRYKAIKEAQQLIIDSSAPAPLVLKCTVCGMRHIDRDAWLHRPHRSHKCEYCNNIWRPYEYNTVGV